MNFTAEFQNLVRPIRRFWSDLFAPLRRAWARQPRPARWAIGAIGIALLYLLPVINPPIITTEPGVNFSSVLGGTIVLYVLVALGLNVVIGMAGMLDLGYAGFYAVGAYVCGVLTSKHASWPWIASLPVAVLVTMLAGVILGSPTLRLRGDYLAIVTLGFGEIIRIVAKNVDWLGAAEGISNIKRPVFDQWEFDVINTDPYYWLYLTITIGVVFLLRRLVNSRVGRAWTAIREDEDAAELMGVPTFKFKLLAFAIGAAIGGLAGVLFAGKNGLIYPTTFDIQLSILFLAAVVLGGSGSITGAIVGGVLVSYLPERFRFLKESRYFWFGIVLVFIMVFRPQGLIGSRRRRRELAEPQDQPDFPGVAGSDLAEAVEPHEGGTRHA
ncbi:MAG: branched-chain amino acid ABC transporter permease [Acidimicrobiales bacterium]